MSPKEVRRARLRLDLTLDEFGKMFDRTGKAAWRWEQLNDIHHSPIPDAIREKLKHILSEFNNSD